MRRALLSLVAGPLLLGIPVSARAEEDKPEASALLKVPLAEARPTGVEGEENITPPDPSPTPPLLAEADPPAAGEPVRPADDGITRPAFPLSRYEPLWQRSPFQLESVAPPVESAGLAQRFALTGIAEINGEPMAFVMERATQNRLMVKANSTGWCFLGASRCAEKIYRLLGHAAPGGGDRCGPLRDRSRHGSRDAATGHAGAAADAASDAPTWHARAGRRSPRGRPGRTDSRPTRTGYTSSPRCGAPSARPGRPVERASPR